MQRLFDRARMQFCEQAIGGPIKHPADVWTNVGPLLAGLFILKRSRNPLERLLGAAAVWTAGTSAYFHATDTILGEALDVGGMFLFILTVAAFQQRRASCTQRATPGQHQNTSDPDRPRFSADWVYVSGVVALSSALACASVYTVVFASPTFAVIVALVIIREARSAHLIGHCGKALLVTFAVAWAIWWLDYLRIFCYPANHVLTGHGVWHLLNGLVFWLTFLHFRGVDSEHADDDRIDREADVGERGSAAFANSNEPGTR